MKRNLAILLSLGFLAACGDDDKSTGPEKNPLVGSWTIQGEGEETHSTFTFEDNGTMIFSYEISTGSSDLRIEFTGTWSAVGNRLTIRWLGGVLSYEISGGKLTFSYIEEGISSFAHYAYETEGDPGGVLTGVTWVDEYGSELVFNSDGTYRWGEGEDDFEEGEWTAEGRTITVYQTDQVSYVLSGNQLTMTDSNGQESVLVKE